MPTEEGEQEKPLGFLALTGSTDEELEDIPFITPNQIAYANRVAEAHWRSALETEWAPKCPDCKDGKCPREDFANKTLGQIMRLMFR